MAKESTHRADELKDLGWSSEDISRYIELWDYRQRWGAINLEREDRQFLRKADAALPKIVISKSSIKKPINEKSYYKRLRFYLDAMAGVESDLNIPNGAEAIWVILLEEELRILDYYEPVLGLPDALKAKAFEPFREQIVSQTIEDSSLETTLYQFDFNAPFENLKSTEGTNWRPLREANQGDKTYAVLSAEAANSFRAQVRKELASLIRDTLPSLKDTQKPLPPDDWNRD